MRWQIAVASVLAGVTLALCADARIPRSQSEVFAFRLANACPSTGRHRGPCPGYQVDHIEPICAGGPDRPQNMQWLSLEEHHYKTRTDVRVCRQLRLERARAEIVTGSPSAP